MVESEKRDPCGVIYDTSHVDSRGTTHYTRHKALGYGGGPASWSDEYDCDPICGCHLSARCKGCGVCMSCDGCYCGELRGDLDD